MTERGLVEGRAGQYDVKACRGHADYIKCMKLCKGKLATTSHDGTVQLYDSGVGGRRPLVKLELSAPPTAMDYDGARLVAADANGNILFWSQGEPEKGVQQMAGQHNQGVSCLVLHGDLLFSGGISGDVGIWSFETLNRTHTFWNFNHQIKQILVIPEDRIVVVCNEGLKVWSIEHEKILGEFQLITSQQQFGPFGAFTTGSGSLGCFIRRGKIILVTQDGEIQEFDIPKSKEGENTLPQMLVSRTWSFRAPSNQMQYDFWQRQDVRLTAVDCSEKHIAFGRFDGSVALFELSTLRQLYCTQGEKGPVNCVKVDDFKVISAHSNLCIKVWDLINGTPLYTLLGGSIQIYQQSPQHPSLQGVSLLDYDDTKICAAMASIARVYNFEL